MEKAVQRHVEPGLHGRYTGQAGGRDRRAVVAALARDDLLFLGPPQGVVVVPDQLDDGVVGFRTGIDQENLGELLGRNLDQFLRKRGCRRRRSGQQVVVGGQPAHLIVSRLSQFRFVEAKRGALHPGSAVDVAVSAIVGDIDAVSLGNHHQLVFVRVSKVSEPVDLVGDVAGGQCAAGYVSHVSNRELGRRAHGSRRQYVAPGLDPRLTSGALSCLAGFS